MTIQINFHKEEQNYPDRLVGGVDEAGRGPLAGPVSIGLVKFSPATIDLVHQGKILQQLNDSKKLTEKKREYLYAEIKECAEIALCQFVSNNYIDKYGINPSIWYAIRKLVKKSGMDRPLLLIDGNYNFKNYPDVQSIEYKSIIRGDEKVISIAAASIIAKVERDRYMVQAVRKYPGYGYEKHKGYGTASHIEAIKKLGHSKIHRLSYKLKNEI